MTTIRSHFEKCTKAVYFDLGNNGGSSAVHHASASRPLVPSSLDSGSRVLARNDRLPPVSGIGGNLFLNSCIRSVTRRKTRAK